MNDWKYLKLEYIVPVIYLSAVVFSIIFTFGIEDYNNLIWSKILMLLTVPWGLLVGLLAMFLLHEDIKSLIIIMYLVSAGINTFLLYLGFKRRNI